MITFSSTSLGKMVIPNKVRKRVESWWTFHHAAFLPISSVGHCIRTAPETHINTNLESNFRHASGAFYVETIDSQSQIRFSVHSFLSGIKFLSYEKLSTPSEGRYISDEWPQTFVNVFSTGIASGKNSHFHITAVDKNHQIRCKIEFTSCCKEP